MGSEKVNCEHKNVFSVFISKTEDHVTLCPDCRSVVHWCNVTEDEWRDLEKWREEQKESQKNA